MSPLVHRLIRVLAVALFVSLGTIGLFGRQGRSGSRSRPWS